MPEPKIILMTNIKGGVGKSTLCEEICYYFDGKNIPYSFIPMDTQGGLSHPAVENESPQYVLIDTPGKMDALTQIDIADLLIVPMAPIKKALDPTLLTLRAIKNRAKRNAKILIVLAQWDRYSAAQAIEEIFMDSFKREFPDSSSVRICKINASKLFDKSAIFNKSVIDCYKKSKPAIETAAFLETMMSLLNESEEE